MPNIQCHLRSSVCAAEMFSFSAAPTQAPQKFVNCSESRTPFRGEDSQDHCHGKSPGHLGGCVISQNAYWKPELSLLSQKQRICSTLTIRISIVKVFNSMCTQSLWTSEYPPCIWWYVWGENRQASVSGKWYETQGKYIGFPLMSVNLRRVVPIPTTVLALVTSLTGISHLT